MGSIAQGAVLGMIDHYPACHTLLTVMSVLLLLAWYFYRVLEGNVIGIRIPFSKRGIRIRIRIRIQIHTSHMLVWMCLGLVRRRIVVGDVATSFGKYIFLLEVDLHFGYSIAPRHDSIKIQCNIIIYNREKKRSSLLFAVVVRKHEHKKKRSYVRTYTLLSMWILRTGVALTFVCLPSSLSHRDVFVSSMWMWMWMRISESDG